ncbi:MAG: TIGR04282 family arsenosugar biosynthesis glycosyltransferase [Candidatus Cyclobacteriaceae bacterium M3_2C_046]
MADPWYKSLLILFIKNPLPGQVKTRIAAQTNDETAYRIYQELLNHTHQTAELVQKDKAVFYSHFIDRNDPWDNKRYLKKLQQGQDLGQKMFHAFDQGFALGYHKICLVGSDIFELSAPLLEAAFRHLDQSDVVLGPAADGGYYLIGLKKMHDFLFLNRTWSHDQVYKQTEETLRKHQLTWSRLPVLSDVDDLEDVLRHPELAQFISTK